MTNSWHAYGSIYNLGHKAIEHLFTVPCYLEEKIDGSQFSFMVTQDDPNEEFSPLPGTNRTVYLKSKKVPMHWQAPMQMFNAAASTVIELAPLLHPGWTYRGEYLAKPSHNALAYDRVPVKHIILFDIATGDGETLNRAELEAEGHRIGLEVTPCLHWGTPTESELRALLDNTVSCLGGQNIEGVVIKQQLPVLFGPDKKILMGKFVSERFREVHKEKWGENNPSQGDTITRIASQYCTPARWAKAVQHLREAGALTESVKDIGNLIREIPLDVETECADEIRDALYKAFWPHIKRMLTSGFPQWYKEELMRRQFEQGTSTDTVPSNTTGDDSLCVPK